MKEYSLQNKTKYKEKNIIDKYVKYKITEKQAS